MSSSKNYYSSIYKRFTIPKKTQSTSDSQVSNIRKEQNIVSRTQLNDNELEQHYEKFTLNKRNAKELLKIQIDALHNYFDDKSEWNRNTIKTNLKIVCSFIIYLSTMDQSDLKNFLISKFGSIISNSKPKWLFWFIKL